MNTFSVEFFRTRFLQIFAFQTGVHGSDWLAGQVGQVKIFVNYGG